ncbi:tripartite motif-containing protein 2-like [Glandiceps talaboti]
MATEKTQFLEKIDENFLLCSICSERYRNAKTLPCQHNFCLTCLQETVKRSNKLLCSICRRVHKIPSGGVDNLPNNLFLNALVEQFEQRDHQIEESKKCGGCEEGDIEVRCIECSVSLCGNCARTHKKLPLTRSHRLMALDEYKATKSTDPVLVQPALNCSKHPHQQLSFFCDKCDEAICLECTVVDHRIPEHEHRYLKDVAAEYTKDVHKMMNELKTKENEVKQNKTNLQERIVSLDKCVDAEKKKLKERVEIIVKQIKETEKCFSEQINAEYEARKTNLQAELKELERTENDLSSTREYVSNITQYGGAAQLMIAKRGITSQMQELMKIETEEPPTYNNEDMEFIPSKYDFEDTTTIGALKGVADVTQCSVQNIPKYVGSDQRVSVSLITKSKYGFPVNISEKEVEGILTRHDGKTTNMYMVDNRSGSMTLTTDFITLHKECHVSVSIRGKPIQGVPVTIKVDPLRLHAKCHGQNVTVFYDCRSARRVRSYNEAIVLTKRSLSCNEKISMYVNKEDNDWVGSVKIGFTKINPDITQASSLPDDGPDLITSWVQRVNLKQENNTLKYWVTKEGQLLYSTNDGHDCVLLEGIDTKKQLWGVIDIYGRTTRIELISFDI